MKTPDIIEGKTWTELSEQQQNLISAKTVQMLCCLEKDIRHMEQVLEDLDKIRALVLKRDENALTEMLEKIQIKADEHKNQEHQRQFFREELAHTLNCSAEEVTLSKIEQILPEKLQPQVKGKRVKLHSLSEKLKREHLNTILLLAECARFNRMVLNGIFKPKKTDTITYSSSGTALKQPGNNFMNLKM